MAMHHSHMGFLFNFGVAKAPEGPAGGWNEPEAEDKKIDREFFEAAVKSQNKLKDTVKECIPFRKDMMDGIERKHLFNKLRARGFSPSLEELNRCLRELVDEHDVRRISRNSVQRWVRIR